MSKTKAEALRIIHNGAVAYQNNLANKNVLFVTLVNGKTEQFEASFLPRNFLHLTGVRTTLNSTTFFLNHCAFSFSLSINSIARRNALILLSSKVCCDLPSFLPSSIFSHLQSVEAKAVLASSSSTFVYLFMTILPSLSNIKAVL